MADLKVRLECLIDNSVLKLILGDYLYNTRKDTNFYLSRYALLYDLLTKWPYHFLVGLSHSLIPSNTESEIVKVSSITIFFYDDPSIPYARLPHHDLDQSPCYTIIAKKQGYFYCR